MWTFCNNLIILLYFFAIQNLVLSGNLLGNLDQLSESLTPIDQSSLTEQKEQASEVNLFDPSYRWDDPEDVLLPDPNFGDSKLAGETTIIHKVSPVIVNQNEEFIPPFQDFAEQVKQQTTSTIPIYQLPQDIQRFGYDENLELPQVDEEISALELTTLGLDRSLDLSRLYKGKDKLFQLKGDMDKLIKIKNQAQKELTEFDETMRNLADRISTLKKRRENVTRRKDGIVDLTTKIGLDDELERLNLEIDATFAELSDKQLRRKSKVHKLTNMSSMEINLAERLRRTEDNINRIQQGLQYNKKEEFSAIQPEIQQQNEEPKQGYYLDELSMASRLADSEMSPNNYGSSLMYEPSEVSSVPKRKAKPNRELSFTTPEINEPSELSASEQSNYPSENVASAFHPNIDLKEAFKKVLKEFSYLDMAAVKELVQSSDRINLINFAQSCIFEVNEALLNQNKRRSMPNAGKDTIKICQELWKLIYQSLLELYVIPPATLRTLFKLELQANPKTNSALTNFYSDSQFTELASILNVKSPEAFRMSCTEVLLKRFSSSGFGREEIDEICRFAIMKMKEMTPQNAYPNKEILSIALKLSFFKVVPYSFDFPPFSSANDLDNFVARFPLNTKLSSKKFADLCREYIVEEYGSSSTYGLENSSLEVICKKIMKQWDELVATKAVNINIFSRKVLHPGITKVLERKATVISYFSSAMEANKSENSYHIPAVQPEESSFGILNHVRENHAQLTIRQNKLDELIARPENSEINTSLMPVFKSVNEIEKKIERLLESSSNSLLNSPSSVDLGSEFEEHIRRAEEHKQILEKQKIQLNKLKSNMNLSSSIRNEAENLYRDTSKRSGKLDSQIEVLTVNSPTPHDLPSKSINELLDYANKINKEFSDLRTIFLRANVSDKQEAELDRMSSQLNLLNRQLTQPNLSKKSLEIKRTLEKLSQKISALNQSIRVVSPESNQTIMTRSKSPDLNQLEEKIVDYIARITRKQQSTSRALSIGSNGHITSAERSALRKNFVEVDGRIKNLVRLLTKLASTSSSAVTKIADHWLSEINRICEVQKDQLSKFLISTGKGVESVDGKKVTSMIKECDNKVQTIKKLVNNSPKSPYLSPKSSVPLLGGKYFKESKYSTPSSTPPPFSAPGQRDIARIKLPSLALFSEPVTPTKKYQYKQTLKDSKGVPIVAGPVLGSKVASTSEGYIQKIEANRVAGVYPEDWRPKGSVAARELKMNPKTKPINSREIARVARSKIAPNHWCRDIYPSLPEPMNIYGAKLYSRLVKQYPTSNVKRVQSCHVVGYIYTNFGLEATASHCSAALLELMHKVSIDMTVAKVRETICEKAGFPKSQKESFQNFCPSAYQSTTGDTFYLNSDDQVVAQKLLALWSECSVPLTQPLSSESVCMAVATLRLSLPQSKSILAHSHQTCVMAFVQLFMGDTPNSSVINAVEAACIEAGFTKKSQ